MFSKPRVSLKEHVAEKKVKKRLEAYLVLLCRQIFQRLQLSLLNICQLWQPHSYSNPSKHAGEHCVFQNVALSNDSILLSTGTSQEGAETGKEGWEC